MPATGNTTTEEIVVYDPRDGTVIEQLGDEPTGLLAHLALELKQREQRFHQMRELVEAELTARVQQGGRRTVLVEGLELKIDSGRGRVWDGIELEIALERLVEQGVLRAGELTGIVTRPPRVDGKAAARLLGLLHGPALSLVEDCFRWEQKGRSRLVITPSIQLIPEETT